MVFEYLDLKQRSPYLSLALDEAIVRHFASNRGDSDQTIAGLRLWANPDAVVLGRTCKIEKNVTSELISAYQVSHCRRNWSRRPTICRRASGGGTVLHGAGNINFSLYFSLERFPELFALQRSYSQILGMIQSALRNQSIDTILVGSDLVLPGEEPHRKISGKAQFRKMGYIVHHGTLITRPNLIDDIGWVLLHPPQEPGYRAGRSHEKFLGHLPDSFDFTAFYNSLAGMIRQFTGSEYIEPLAWSDRAAIFAQARALVREYYGSRDWIESGVVPRGKPPLKQSIATKSDRQHA